MDLQRLRFPKVTNLPGRNRNRSFRAVLYPALCSEFSTVALTPADWTRLRTLPAFRPPQLATLQAKIPASDSGLFEMKDDGYRMHAATLILCLA